ncbi:MFS transporter [Patescibacteria group bacterium]|nr:MFS transporter [Patescibacteria group bacterium]
MEHLRGNRWLTLLIISIGFLMILIDTTIVNVSIPTIIKDLNANLSDIEWIISGYALSFAALLITFGRLGDMYGRRLFFIIGLIVFTVSSFFSGEAGSASTLIIARLFQGVGGAIISPATLSIISSSFKGRERALAFGIWGAVAGIAVAIGPILGGWFTTYYTWRWIFRVNIPIGIIGILAAWLIITESRVPHTKRLDLSGMVTSTIGFFFLVFGLIEGQNYGWILQKKPLSIGGLTWNHHTSFIFWSFIISIVFLVVFFLIQYYKTKRHLSPAVDLAFFQFRSFRYGLVAIGVISLGEFSSLFTMPIFLQSVKGFTPLHSGYAVLPLAITTFIAAPLSARVVNRIGTKWVISLGIFIEFLGLLLLGRLHADTAYTALIPGFIVLGAGIGLAIAQNTQVILSEVPVQESGSASGILNTVRQVGSALGIAIIGAVLASQLSANVTTQLNAVPNLPSGIKDQITSTVDASGVSASTEAPAYALPAPSAQVQNNPVLLARFRQQEARVLSEVKNGINNALADSIAASIRVGSWFVLLGALLSLLIPNVKPHRE